VISESKVQGIIVLLGDVLAEELMDSGDEWRGGATQIGLHSTADTTQLGRRNTEIRTFKGHTSIYTLQDSASIQEYAYGVNTP
jgi:hypothetical protein